MLNNSMPRGRVIEDPIGYFTIFHGNDFPSKYTLDSQIKKIVSAFDLSAPYMLKKVNIEYTSHETMDKSEMETLEDILGIEVPY
jgi:hypothetical protein